MNARQKILERAAKEAGDRGKPVFMGTSSGVVDVPGEPGKIYVTDSESHVQKVWNATSANVAGHVAFIKKVDKRLQVTSLWDIYSNFIYPKVAPHHYLHEWAAAGTDIIRVWAEQWMPWKVEPIGSFTIRIYQNPFRTSIGWQDGGTSDIDLSVGGHIPVVAGSGRYVLLTLDTSGSFVLTDGTPQADYHDLTINDVPDPPAGNKYLFAIRLYEGQTELVYNPTMSDFIDLRQMQGGTATLPTYTPNRILFTDGTGVVGVDNYLYYDNKLIIDGATSVPATNPVAMHLVYEGAGVTYAGWTASASAADAPYFVGYRARGTMGSPAVPQADDYLTYFRGRGWDANGWTTSKVGIAFVADDLWDTTHHATRIEFSATDIGGGASIGVVATMYGNGVINIPTGATYNINGSPHTHAYLTDAPSNGNTYGRNTGAWVVVTGGGGDFSGPAGATAHHIVTFADATGKVGEDSGHALSEYLTSVTAHNILSTTHGDTLADSVYEGDVLIGNATPKWARLPANSTATKKYLRNYSSGLPSWEQVDWSELNSVPTTFAPVAHNILSSSHGDTLADTVHQGDILYGNATPAWARLSFPGTPTGKVLQATATDVAWSTNPLTIGVSASISGSNTGDQTITLTTDVTGSGTGSFVTTIANSAVTLAKMADMATASLIYRKTAGTGAPEVNTLATLKTDLGLSNTNSGDQVIPNNEAGSAHNFLTAYNNTTGAWSKAQPSTSDISGLGTLAVVNDAPSDGTTYGRKNGAWATTGGGGDISGTGVVGQVAEFVTNTKTLQAANLIAPTANILTLTNAAASTLALAITAGKTLTLTATDNYNLTVPATGTAALLATANNFTATQTITGLLVLNGTIATNVVIGINNNITFSGNTSTVGIYNQPVISTVKSSGFWGMINVPSISATSGGPQIYVYGIYSQVLLNGVATINITNAYGGYFNVANQSTNAGVSTITNAYDLYCATLVKTGVTGLITNAYGLYIEDINTGGILNYAIYTNAGLVHFGGAVDAASLTLTTPLAVAQGGTGATNATDAKTNLGITSGSAVLSDERSWFLV